MTDICDQPSLDRGRVLFDLIRPRPGPALVCPEDGLTLTHEDVASVVTELARCLRSAGVERGDRVAVVLPNRPEIVLCLFASALLGAAAAPLNPEYTETEYRFYLADLIPRSSNSPTSFSVPVPTVRALHALTNAVSELRP